MAGKINDVLIVGYWCTMLTLAGKGSLLVGTWSSWFPIEVGNFDLLEATTGLAATGGRPSRSQLAIRSLTEALQKIRWN